MTDFPILYSLGLIMVTATVAVLLLRLLHVPTLVAYMAAGLLLGPATGLLTLTGNVVLISRVGVALLLFLVGLQLSVASIRGVGRVAALAGSTQVVLTAAVGYAVAVAFGLPFTEAAVAALAVMASSTVVMVKLLGQRLELRATHSRIGLAVSMVQDLSVIMALTVIGGLFSPGAAAEQAPLVGVLRAFGGVGALAVVAAFAGRFALPHVFRWAEGSLDTVLIWSLSWCFLFIVGAEALGLSVELGAFIAGLSLAQLPFAEELRRRVQPLVNFFLAVFFVSLGMVMQPVLALQQWPLVLAFCIIVLVIKPAIVVATVPRLGYGERTSLLSGLSLGHMSEFSFILASAAYAAGVLRAETLSVITLTGFITISVAAYVIGASDRIHARLSGGRLLRLLGARGPEAEPPDPPLRDHIIIIGMNTLGRRLVEALLARGETVLAIDTDSGKLTGLATPTLLGSVDDAAVLVDAHYTDARLVVSALQIEDTNNLLAYRCRAAGVPVSIHAFDESLITELRDIGVDHIIMSKHDGTRQIAMRLREAGIFD